VKPEKIALMPDWPARMGEDMAALYLGVSMTKFRERVAAKEYPQPQREGGRFFWSRQQLDRFVAALTAGGSTITSSCLTRPTPDSRRLWRG
jgi:hypothetical protein